MKTLDSALALEIKDIGDDGGIEGFAAVYGNVDGGGDIILPGAFTKSLRGRKSLPMLLYHDTRRPIGVWNEFEDTAKGLKVRGRIVVETPDGSQAHVLAKAGAIAGLSIGYQTIKARSTEAARELSELGLYEVSLTPTPMNDRATITRVKDILTQGELPSVREFEEFLRDAGGFSKSLAVAIAAKATPHLRGEPDAKANDELREFLTALRG